MALPACLSINQTLLGLNIEDATEKLNTFENYSLSNHTGLCQTSAGVKVLSFFMSKGWFCLGDLLQVFRLFFVQLTGWAPDYSN